VKNNLQVVAVRVTEQCRKDLLPILELPAELRVRIYELLLVTLPRHDPGDLGHKPCLLNHIHEALSSYAALPETTILRVCKQIHMEAKDVLYSHTTFEIVTPSVVFSAEVLKADVSNGINLLRVRKLRFEILLVHAPAYLMLPLVSKIFSTFKGMQHLRRLQIVVTCRGTLSATVNTVEQDL
jgi:hypothetical protein